MTEERWNPTPPGWKPTPVPTPRARGEELWRLHHNGRVASCELRDDREIGAGFEVLIRHDDEIIIGRRCASEVIARSEAETFRKRYTRSGWQRGDEENQAR